MGKKWAWVGEKSWDMRKSLYERKTNFEEVCFELETDKRQKKLVCGGHVWAYGNLKNPNAIE